jgi:hypothetical protein
VRPCSVPATADSAGGCWYDSSDTGRGALRNSRLPGDCGCGVACVYDSPGGCWCWCPGDCGCGVACVYDAAGDPG